MSPALAITPQPVPLAASAALGRALSLLSAGGVPSAATFSQMRLSLPVYGHWMPPSQFTPHQFQGSVAAVAVSGLKDVT